MGYNTDSYKPGDVLWKTKNVTGRVQDNPAAIARKLY